MAHYDMNDPWVEGVPKPSNFMSLYFLCAPPPAGTTATPSPAALPPHSQTESSCFEGVDPHPPGDKMVESVLPAGGAVPSGKSKSLSTVDMRPQCIYSH